MNSKTLILRSLTYYWRTHLAVLLGVIAGTAVIAGALIVGDSVRDSLRQMTLERLGRVDHTLSSHRFFRQAVADDAFADDETYSAAPALVMFGGLEYQKQPAEHEDATYPTVRVGKVNVYGVDDNFWSMMKADEGSKAPTDFNITLSQRVADQLRVSVGEEITLWIEIPSSIPRDTLLGGGDDQTSQEIILTVGEILREELGVARFALTPNQQLPLNVYVPLDTLQNELDLQEITASRRNPTARPARINAMMVAATRQSSLLTEAQRSADAVNESLANALTLEDFGLRVRKYPERDYFSLESERMILDNATADVGHRVAEELKMKQSPVLVYLANYFMHPDNPDAFSMYSIVAGVDFEDLDASPFGPFELKDGSLEKLDHDDIVINEWLAEDVQIGAGDSLKLAFHMVGDHGELPEEEGYFDVRAVLKLDGTAAADRGFTPEVQGITDVDDIGDWDQPFEMDLDRVTDRDDEYWEAYRATPKAFVSLSTAQSLWSSRYGKLTSLRIAPADGVALDEAAQQFEEKFLAQLVAKDSEVMKSMVLQFQPTKAQGLAAAAGTQDFSGLFFGFSFFLILSAAILIGLLFRLAIERRGRSVGLLSAVGLAPTQVRRLMDTEGVIVVLIGGVVGVGAAIAYASLMVYGLKTWWIGAIGTRFLFVSITPQSLTIGFCIAVIIAWIVIRLSLRLLRDLPTRGLLAGNTEKPLSEDDQRERGRRATKTATICTVTSLVLVAGVLMGIIPATEAFGGFSWHVVAFFLVGIAMLTASLRFLSAWLDSDHSGAVSGSGLLGIGRLGLRNASRNRQRSVLSVGLIASATFVIVAVAAGRRNPAVETPQLVSGNGGFIHVAESSTPLLYDLNTDEGRNKLDWITDDEPEEAELAKKMEVIPFAMKPGENASCLNIYQTRLPTILGVTDEMIQRGSFKFADTRVERPWALLTQNHEDEDGAPVIPVLGDMNTLMYSLKKGIGKTISIPNDENPDYKLKVMGMFDGSVFQGMLMMSEANFRKLYPEQVGYQYFLIGDRRFRRDGTASHHFTPSETQKIAEVLETRLGSYGFDVEPIGDRLADFLAVQNTYLQTFQTLGGLGLLLGTIGLATVMLRNVLERRSELALMRAIGFGTSKLAVMVMWENAFLLVWGLVAGTISALLAMGPHLLTTGADVPWLSGGLILLLVFLVGMVAALAAVAEAVRTPIVSTLRAQ